MTVLAFRRPVASRPRAAPTKPPIPRGAERLLAHLRDIAQRYPGRYCTLDECKHAAKTLSDGSIKAYIWFVREHLWKQGDAEWIESRVHDGYRLVKR